MADFKPGSSYNVQQTELRTSSLSRAKDLLRLSVSRLFPKADPLAVIEAAFTSVKYAFYQVVACITLRSLGYMAPSSTDLCASARSGFVGGAIFTAPFLMLLLPVERNALEPSHCVGDWMLLLGKEMLYSAVASGVGIVALRGWSHQDVFMAMAGGLAGPLVSILLLSALLGIALGGLWIARKVLDFSDPPGRDANT